MTINITYERDNPDTHGEHLHVYYTYIGTKEEIDEVEAFCKRQIQTALIINTKEG